MSTYTQVTKDGTLFKTNDGKYINYRGTDISGIVLNTKHVRPQRFVPITSQPKFYLITHEWNEELEEGFDTNIQGPYSTKEEAQEKEMSCHYILLATDEAIKTLEVQIGLVSV